MQLIPIFPLIGYILSSLSTVGAADITYCNATAKCPQSLPCCSTYGTCGNGSYCLGGCDVRYSYNLTACMPMPIMSKMNTTFDTTDLLLDQNTYLGNSTESDWLYTGYIDDYDDALIIQMPNGTTGTVVSSSQYLFYGKILAKVKTSRTQGVITAFILFSDVQDEIDYEFVGYNLTSAQSNYYSQGYLDYHNVLDINTTDTYENWHIYEIDWSEEAVKWLIDGDVVRTLNKSDTWNDTTNRYSYPQTPSRIQMSLWPGGAASNAIGTIEWAGGEVNWDSEDIAKHGYFYAELAWVSVEPYDTPGGVKQIGCNGTSCNAYLYNSTDGDQQNVTMVKKITYLGNEGATGLDPQNEEEEVVSTFTSGSSTFTSTTTKGVTAKVTEKSTTTQGEVTPSGYDPTMGFVQNSDATATGNAESTTRSNAAEVQFDAAGLTGILGAIIMGIISFLS